VIIAFILGGLWGSTLSKWKNQDAGSSGQSPRMTVENDDSELPGLDRFWEVWSVVNDIYVDESGLDSQERIYGAIKGSIKALDDPYSEYLDPEQSKMFTDSLNNELEGIGAELTMEEGLITVVSPLKNSPAEEAGVKPKDIIYEIDGEIATDMTLFEAVLLIRGPKGTTVKLTLLREGVDEPIEVEIKRQKIEVPSVEIEYIGANERIAHVSVSQFSDDTTREFNKFISEVLTKDVDGMVLDLRFNGGGFLNVSTDILSELLPAETPIVLVKGRDPEEDVTLFTNGKSRLSEMPMVVLINNGSASASEIVAGAIQDHERGEVIGEQSFGKGSVQEIRDFVDGSSLRITVSKWYTPNERSIDEEGVTPDIVVEITSEDYEADRDPQLDKAIEYLQNGK